MEICNWQYYILANEHHFELAREEKTTKCTQEEVSITNDLWADYQRDAMSAIYHLGFLKHSKWFTPSFAYLVELCQYFFEELRKVPQLEELRERVQFSLEEEQLTFLLIRKPFLLGEAYVDETFLANFFADMLAYYHHEIHIYAGSGRKPYEVEIAIDPLTEAAWKQLQTSCGNQIESLEVLLQGQFPKALKDAFFVQGQGLFPSPKQIHIACSCPDYAVLCKHAAAVLYAVSIQLDEDPSLFFQLRQIQMEDLIKKALGENVDQLMQNAKKTSTRILVDENIESLFHLI